MEDVVHVPTNNDGMILAYIVFLVLFFFFILLCFIFCLLFLYMVCITCGPNLMVVAHLGLSVEALLGPC